MIVFSKILLTTRRNCFENLERCESVVKGRSVNSWKSGDFVGRESKGKWREIKRSKMVRTRTKKKKVFSNANARADSTQLLRPNVTSQSLALRSARSRSRGECGDRSKWGPTRRAALRSLAQGLRDE